MDEQGIWGPQPIVVWFDQPAVVKQVTGRSVHTLERWAEEGLTIHTRTSAAGTSRSFIVVSEYLSFLLATSRTNHEEARS